MNFKQRLYDDAEKLEIPGKNLIFHTLPNGMRVLYKQTLHSRVSHCGFIVNAGSRNDADFLGTAHCLEHMLFKGTKTRKPFHILNRIDSVGGEINAYTTKEITVLYSTVYELFLDRAMELIFDLTFNSTFPQKELSKEINVIKDEINMYLDSPEENIFDEFQELIFKGHPLANNILGTEEGLEAFNSNVLKDFTNKYYQPENMVMFVVSTLDFKKVLKKIEKYSEVILPKKIINSAFGNYTGKKANFNIEEKVKETDYTQSYVILGGEASKTGTEERLKESFLMNILGGPALNSRLSLAIREKYGFTYNIEAGTTHFKDIGFYHLYAGTDNKHHDKTISLINKELAKLKSKKLGTMQLQSAKNQFTGQIMLAEENKLASALALGTQWLKNENIRTLDEIISIVNSITAEELLNLSNRLFDADKMSRLSYKSED